MGQNLDTMSQKRQSKEEVLYHMVRAGNVEAIKALCREGAGLEWIDIDGKTPLIVACMDFGLLNVAKALIELGANINAYRPGSNAGTPLHHAAKRGLDQTVKLLLSSGAKALVRNDDCQTAVDVARTKGHLHVVRTIENHICYFSGWLREFHGPRFLEALAPQFVSSKIWVFVIPCGYNNQVKERRLQLVIYPTFQDIQPRTVISLWEAKIEEPKFDHSDPQLIMLDQSTRTRYKFASATTGDKQQLRWLYDASRGISQFTIPPTQHAFENGIAVVGHETSAEAAELALSISASIQSVTDRRLQVPNAHHNSQETIANGREISTHPDNDNTWEPAAGPTHSVASSSGLLDETAKEDYNSWCVSNSGNTGKHGGKQNPDNPLIVVQGSDIMNAPVPLIPSAPPIPYDDVGPIHYPSIDSTPVDWSIPPIEHEAQPSVTTNFKDEGNSCIICWEAPVEGACIPCGHMAGCMKCLNEIKAKKGLCPVCRADINQVMRVYAV